MNALVEHVYLLDSIAVRPGVTGLELACTVCGDRICDLAAKDTLDVLVSLAVGHVTDCAPISLSEGV